MAVPDFLIVGAMKAGTTTLYRDLSRHPDVFLPVQKEPETLVRWQTSEQMRSDYASLFANAKAGQYRGEASTVYTKRPTHEHVAQTARTLCSDDLKVIYMRRDPVERIVSHFQHSVQLGQMSGSLADALREHPELIDYSRYEWQIAPWIDCFGAHHVIQIDLAAYAVDRRGVLTTILRHIGVDPHRLPDIDSQSVANRASDAKTVRNPVLRTIWASPVYQRRMKHLLPHDMREKLRRMLLPSFAAPPPVVTPAERSYILTRIAEAG